MVATTLRGIRRGGVAAAAAVFLSALAVLVAGATLAGGLLIARVVGDWRAGLRVVAILRDPNPRPGGLDGLADAARALPGVAAVRAITPAAALAELRALLGAEGEGLDRLPANPVPARLELSPAADLDAAGLAALVRTLERLPAVDQVHAPIGWVAPLERVARGVRLGGFALAACLALAALGAAAAASAAARAAGRDEVAILRLAGVSEEYLVLPGILQAVLLSIGGSGLGLGLLLLGSEPSAPWTGAWLRGTLGLDPLPVLPAGWLASLAGGGALVGLLAGVAARRP